jgi:hypothetical protein
MLRRGRRMVFLTIEPVAGIDDEQLNRAVECGPPEVALDAPHEAMLREAGFRVLDAIDATVEFSATQQAWFDSWIGREPELVALLGRPAFDERQLERLAMRAGIDEGLLRRTLYVTAR